MMLALAPPKPNELLNAYSGVALVGFFTTGKAQTGSGDSSVDVGGNQPSRSAIRQMITSTAPAAPNK